jgi:O-antigen/teichoic acid export membrane protein
MTRPTNQQVIAKNTAWNALDRAIGIASTLITSVAVARSLGPEKLGYYIYLVWVTAIAGTVGSLGVPAATRKFMSEYRGRGEIGVAARIVSTTFRVQVAIALVVQVAALAVVVTLVPQTHRTYALIAVLSLFPLFMVQIATAANVAAEDYGANVKASLASTLVGFSGVIATLIFRWDLVGLASSLLAARVTDFWIRHALFWRRHRRQTDGAQIPTTLPADLRERMFAFSMRSVGVLLIAAVVWDRSELFFLQMFTTARDLAFYSLGFNITQQVMMVPQVFSSAAGSTLMVVYGRDRLAAARIATNTLRYLAIATLPMMIGIAALSEPLVSVVYGRQYVEAIPVLTACALFMIPKAVLLPAQQLLTAGERQSALLKWGAVCAGVNIALDLLLIPDGKAIGAAIANGLTQVLAGLGIWFIAIRAFEMSLPWQLLIRVTASAATMGVVVAVFARYVSSIVALAAGVPLGVIVYATMLKITSALTPEDWLRLRHAQAQALSFLRRFTGASIPRRDVRGSHL